MIRSLSLAAALSFAFPLLAQQPDLKKAADELAHVFDRDSGPIGDAQKANLAAWLKRYEGQDVGALAYARSLQLYLDRDYDSAVAALDEYFKRFHTVDNAEHRMMVGRVYVNALSREINGTGDADKVARYAERTACLYTDAAMLTRLFDNLGGKVKDQAAFRVALAKGVAWSELATAEKDGFLKHLYAGAADAKAPAGRGSVPAAPIRPLPAEPAPDASKVVKNGQVVETFAAETVLNGPHQFDLASYRGKVVLLDFFATWCKPCRDAVPGLVALQKQHGDALRVVGVTRFYGNGMDFSDAAAQVPHGGKVVKNLDKDAEIAVNKAFLKAFQVDYPLVFAEANVAKERFGVTGIPTMFVIGKDGKLAGSVEGASDEKHKELLELVAQELKK